MEGERGKSTRQLRVITNYISVELCLCFGIQYSISQPCNNDLCYTLELFIIKVKYLLKYIIHI